VELVQAQRTIKAALAAIGGSVADSVFADVIAMIQRGLRNADRSVRATPSACKIIGPHDDPRLRTQADYCH
jgi:hypothetical protein